MQNTTVATSTSLSSSSAVAVQQHEPSKKNQKQTHNMLENCPVCLEAADESVAEVCILDKCGHIFHSACLQCALIEKNACPICRSEITVCQHNVHSAATLLEENKMLRAALSDFKKQKQEFGDNILAQMMQRHEQRAQVDRGDQLFHLLQASGGDRHPSARVETPPLDNVRISSSIFNSFVSGGHVHIPEVRNESVRGPADVTNVPEADVDLEAAQRVNNIFRQIFAANMPYHSEQQ